MLAKTTASNLGDGQSTVSFSATRPCMRFSRFAPVDPLESGVRDCAEARLHLLTGGTFDPAPGGEMRRTVCLVMSLTMLGGCAAPGTPGAGVGADYTPVIDLDGVNQGRYSSDLQSCRAYANSINAGANAAGAAVGGAIVGALIAAAFGLRGRNQADVATYGAVTWGAGAAGHSLSKQQRIITNCMAGRGYRTLDAPYAIINGTNSPYAPVVELSVAAIPVSVQTVAAPQSEKSPGPVGTQSFQVEHLDDVRSCAAQPRATLVAHGPGFESYSVQCDGGDSLLARCEFGNCHVLK